MKGFGPKNHFKEHNKNSNSFESDRLINDALTLHSKGKISDAKRSYQDLIKNGISDPRVFTNLGVIFQSENDYERSIKLYKKSINLFPESHEAYSNLSRILLETGQYDLAETYLIKVIKLKPDFLIAYQNLFNVYFRNNKLKKAEIILYDCLKIAPNNPLVLSNLGRFLFEKGIFVVDKIYSSKGID